MSKQKAQRSRVRIGKLKKSVSKLSKTEQKKVKCGVLADGSVRTFGDFSVRFIKDGTSNT